MFTIRRASGLSVQLSDDYELVDMVSAPAVSSLGQRRSLRRAAEPLDPVVQSAIDQELQLVDALAIQRSGQATESVLRQAVGVTGTADARATAATRLTLDLDPTEDAIVLLEQNGVYSWHPPGPGGVAVTPAALRGAQILPPTKRVIFDLPVFEGQPAGEVAVKRGLVGDFLLGQVRTYVLKFAAGLITGQAMKFLERNVRRGLVVMDAEDSTAWRRVDDLASLTLPADRPARILLFIHGTFSSTAGSFGALVATPWGRQFMAAARERYDLILGFDHPTLSEDPLANASDLLARLEKVKLRFAPDVDAVAYSRGGLVLRVLVEHLLPASAWHARIGRSVFVACTNDGTKLAEPDNWNQFIDLYTNLAVAGSRALRLVAPAAPVAAVVKEGVQGIAALAKYIVADAAQERMVPGLAAMVPGGPFIERMNQTPTTVAAATDSNYYVVRSQFAVDLNEGITRELPQQFLGWLASEAVAQIMSDANDLVVNDSSMVNFGAESPSVLKDLYDFGKNSQVYHTVYFIRPETANSLARWLQLETPAANLMAFQREGVESPSRLGQPHVPAMVDTDIVQFEADADLADVTEVIRRRAPSFVVVHREDSGRKFRYAYSADELAPLAQDVGGRKSLFEALVAHANLAMHETSASEEIDAGRVGASRAGIPLLGAPMAQRRIVVDADGPVGVVPSVRELLPTTRLGDLASLIVCSGVNANPVLERRVMPSLATRLTTAILPRGESLAGTPAAAAGLAPSGPEGAATPASMCYFTANMPNQVAVGSDVNVLVTISREMIEQMADAVSQGGSGTVDNSRTLVVVVCPKTNLQVVGPDHFELPPPAPRNPIRLAFVVRATNDQGGGEVWITIQQGTTILANLTLRPSIVPVGPAPATHSITAESYSAEASPNSELLPLLQILEGQDGANVYYTYVLDVRCLGGANGIQTYRSPNLPTDRNTFIEAIYQAIETRYLANQRDLDAFALELQAYGISLFNELLPENLRRELWQRRGILRAIQVVSQEPFIPWELVHLCDPDQPPSVTPVLLFLGQFGLVRWLHGVPWPPEKIRVRSGRSRYLVPTYSSPLQPLPETQVEAEYLAREFGSQAIPADRKSVYDAVRGANSPDLFHFAGHGMADQQRILGARMILGVAGQPPNYDGIDPPSVKGIFQMKTGDGNRALVVLNACQVGRLGGQLSSLGGFADAFLSAQAGAFVGALWSVGDKPASVFTTTLYDLLKRGMKLIDAARAARDEARRLGDSTWLAYVVYGHPNMTLSLS